MRTPVLKAAILSLESLDRISSNRGLKQASLRETGYWTSRGQETEPLNYDVQKSLDYIGAVDFSDHNTHSASQRSLQYFLIQTEEVETLDNDCLPSMLLKSLVRLSALKALSSGLIRHKWFPIWHKTVGASAFGLSFGINLESPQSTNAASSFSRWATDQLIQIARGWHKVYIYSA